MLSTIDFNDEALAKTDKIDNVGPDRRLTPHMKAAGPKIAELHPELRLLWR